MVAAIAEVFTFCEDWHQHDRAVRLVEQYQLNLAAVLRDRTDLQDCVVDCCHCEIQFLTHPCNRRRRDMRCPFGCRKHHRRQQANARSQKHYQSDAGRRSKKQHNGKRSLAVDSPRSIDAPTNDSSAIESPLECPSLESASIEPRTIEPSAESRSVDSSVEWPVENGSCPELPVLRPVLAPPVAALSSSVEVRWLSTSARAPSTAPLSPATAAFVPLARRPWPLRGEPGRPAGVEQWADNEHDSPAAHDNPACFAWEEDDIVLTDASLENSSVLSYLCLAVSLIEQRPIGRGELLQVLRQSMRQRSLSRRARREYVLEYLQQHPP